MRKIIPTTRSIKKPLKKIYHKIHDLSPKLSEAVNLATAVGVISTNSIVLGSPLGILGATKMFTGSKVADDGVIKIAKHWIATNNAIIDTIFPEKDWRIDMPDDVSENKQYLLISNHQSWVDTSIVQYISQNKLPLTRFFTKFDLIYIPIVGQAFYFLDFPMMKRFSREAIAKNPELRNQNLIEANRACKQLRDKPFTLLNYLEGTRFTPEKHAKQKVTYTHLLKPRAGGLSLAVNALGRQIDGILDITIVYPDGIPSYDDLWKGKVRRLGVHVERIYMPDDLFNALMDGRYDKDEATKQTMFAWLDEIWRQKDERMTQMLADFEDQ